MTPPGPRRFAALAAAVVAVLVLVVVRWAPPAPRDAGAPPDAFSAARAEVVLRALVGDGAPRPLGSAAVARARGVAKQALADAGYTVEERDGFACNARAICGFVTNVVARRDASPGGDARPVLLVAHLDSVGAGPGAGDDGLGAAAVLEAARALAIGPPLARPVVVLLTDGEEAGLLGATALASASEARDAAGVVNLDARGTSGPSMLFELTGGAPAVELVAAGLRRPVTASLFAEIYRRMPNDTDFSVFRHVPLGANFGNVAGVERYHTSRDALGAVDRGTLQHHGEQALAMVRAFAAATIEAPRPAVWFDVLGLFVVRWPATWMLPLAAIALALLLTGAVLARRARVVLAGALGALAALVSGLAVATALGAAFHGLGALPAPWIAHPLPLLVALGSAAILAATLGWALVHRALGVRDAGDARPSWCGAWLVLAALGLALSLVAPGAAYLFVAPALIAGVAALVPSAARAFLSTAAVLAGAVLWLTLLWPLYVVLGALAPPALVLPLVVVASMSLPLAPRAALAALARHVRARLVLAAALVPLASGLAFVALPRFSADVPQRVNVVVRQDEDGPAFTLASPSWGLLPWGEVPPAMAAALGATERRLSPWAGALAMPAHASPSFGAEVPPPEVVVEDAARGRVHVRSRRGADVILVELPGNVGTIRVEGAAVAPRGGLVLVRGVGAAGFAFELGVPARDVRVADMTRGVAPSEVAAAVVAARPPEAVPSQDGDVLLRAARVGR